MNELRLRKKVFYIFLAIIITSLISAYYIEYILGVKPCVLCIYQRIPYIVGLILCIGGLFELNNMNWMRLVFLTFFLSIFLSGYHVGIENSIIDEFKGCLSNLENPSNKEDLLKSLANKMPSCKNVEFKLFGLSLATINLFVSFTICLIIFLTRYEKNR